MTEHPKHILLTRYRRAIYDEFGITDQRLADRARAYLSLITMHHILPIWMHRYPDDELLPTAVRLIEGMLDGTIDPGQVDFRMDTLDDDTAGTALVYLTSETYRTKRNLSALFVKVAVEGAFDKALWVASGRRPPNPDFRLDYEAYIDSDEADTEEWGYLSVEDNRDTAAWAATAYAWEGVQGPPDPERRREFWEWWLTEAIPAAWHLSGADSGACE